MPPQEIGNIWAEERAACDWRIKTINKIHVKEAFVLIRRPAGRIKDRSNRPPQRRIQNIIAAGIA